MPAANRFRLDSLRHIYQTFSRVCRRTGREIARSVGELFHFIQRATTLACAYAAQLKAKRAYLRAELSVGQSALDSGQGNEGLLRSLSDNADESSSTRRILLRRLAQDVKTKVTAGDTAERIGVLDAREAELRKAEAFVRDLRQGVLPTGEATRRVVVGGLVIGLVLSLGAITPFLMRVNAIAVADDGGNFEGSGAHQALLPPLPDGRIPGRRELGDLKSDEPPEGSIADVRIVELVTRATSDHYQESGFKDFEFGMSEAQVRSVAERNPVSIDEGRQRFFMEEGRLIGYERLYLQDNADYVAKLRELFGGAFSENLTEADGIQQGATVDRLGNSVAAAARNRSFLARYYFPNSVAYVQASWGASAQGNVNSVSHQEHVLLNIFDRRWMGAALVQHVAECREALERVRQIVANEAAGILRLNDVHALPGTVVSYTAPENDARLETLKLLGARNEPFVIVERALKDLYERPRNSVSIGVHLSAKTGSVYPLAKYTYLGIEMDRCNSIVGQDIFPARGTTIRTERARDSHRPSYVWQTSSGWKITVAPGGHIYLTNIPEKGL